jgi:hypothetical protein
MELDELKYQLNHKLATEHPGRSDADIAFLLTRKTSSVIGKLKRSLWFEIIVCILITLGFAVVGMMGKFESLRIYFSVFAVFGIGFLTMLVYLLRRTIKLSSTALPVKSNLETIVKIIEDFIRRYFQFTIALMPICFIFSFLLGYHEQQHMTGMDMTAKKYFSSGNTVLVVIIVYLCLLAAGVYYFTKWYLKKLYGNYVQQLKECIKDLSEE